MESRFFGGALQARAAEREEKRQWLAELAARKEAKDRAKQGPPKGQPQRWVQMRHNFNTATNNFHSRYRISRKSPSQNGEKDVLACQLWLLSSTYVPASCLAFTDSMSDAGNHGDQIA